LRPGRIGIDTRSHGRIEWKHGRGIRDEDAQVVVDGRHLNMVRATTGGESLIHISSVAAAIMLGDYAWPCV
jgi:hypothetical protein